MNSIGAGPTQEQLDLMNQVISLYPRVQAGSMSVIPWKRVWAEHPEWREKLGAMDERGRKILLGRMTRLQLNQAKAKAVESGSEMPVDLIRKRNYYNFQRGKPLIPINGKYECVFRKCPHKEPFDTQQAAMMHMHRIHTGKIPSASPEAVAKGLRRARGLEPIVEADFTAEKPKKRRKYQRRAKPETTETVQDFMAKALTTDNIVTHLDDIVNRYGAYEEARSPQALAVIKEVVRRLRKADQPDIPIMPRCPQCGFNIQMFNAAYAVAKKHSDA